MNYEQMIKSVVKQAWCVQRPDEYHKVFEQGNPSQYKRLIDVMDSQFEDHRDESGRAQMDTNYQETVPKKKVKYVQELGSD